MAKQRTTGSRVGRGPARGTNKSAGVSGAERRRDRSQPVDLGRALVEAFLTNDRINQVLLELLDPKVWRAQPPCSNRRNIATTFAHIHNVRCMRIRMSARDEELPAKLDRAEVTQAEAKESLSQSSCAMVRLIERSLASGGHVSEYRPDVVGLVCAAITHDAYHRGQICHWASQLGAPLTPEQQLEVWEWDKRWKEVAGD
jgi:uncharacterized damage-inducible protein DinB